MARMRIDADAIKTVGAELSVPADVLDRARRHLLKQLEAMGDVWGDDEFGDAARRDYDPMRGRLVDGAAQASGTVTALADQVKAAGRRYEATEADNVTLA